MIGLVETKINCQQYERTIVPLRAQIKTVWQNNKFTIVDARETTDTDSIYKPGGVMQITIGPTSARIRQKDNDIGMGRWTSQIMTHANGTKSVFYTVYRVCQKSAVSAGPTTAAQQQWRALRDKGETDPNPRKQFLIDLKAEIQDKIGTGFEIFVMGDFNTRIHDRELQDFMYECDLFDLHEPSSQHSTAPPTFKKGRHKIDHMLGTYFFMEATISASILSWQDSLPGDHLCLVIDLCQNVLQSQSNDLTSPQQRTLTSTSPAKVEKYNKSLNDLMEKSKIVERLTTLTTKCTQQGLATPRQERAFQNIDIEMTNYMKYAEKKCSKSTKNPRHAYSPALTIAGQEIHKIKQKKQEIEILLPWTNNEQLEQQLQQHKEQLEFALKNAWSKLKQAQAHSRLLREAHLQKRAETYAKENNAEASKAIEMIRQSEKSKRIYSKIQRYLKPNKSEPLDRLLIQDGEGWKETTDAQEIYALLTKQAIIDMSGPGTDKTPFTIPPLSEIIPPWTPSPYNDEILNGTFEPPETDTEEACALLSALMYKDGIAPPQLPTMIAIETFTGTIKAKSESTASSPSGRHIGHYKAATKNEQLLQFHLDIINFARLFTCLPPRWCTAIQVRIPKITGTPRIDKLRMIQLLEFDMNAQFGITIGREMIWNAEEQGQFEDTPNFGNRKNSKAPSGVLLKRITYDIMRQQLLSGAVGNNDLEKCYDRVLAGIGMISVQRLGVPKKVTDLKLKLLERIQFYSRSAFGLSPTAFGNEKSTEIPAHHTDQTPRDPFVETPKTFGKIYGILQGTQDAGAIFLALWAVLYKVLSMIVPGQEYSSADFSITSKRKGEAFVDDTDIWITETTMEDNQHETLTKGITELFQRWYRILRASGGMLGFKKCFWYLIKFKWKANGKPYMASIDETPGELKIETDDHRGTVTIERLPPEHGLKTLGVRLAPNCEQTDEFNYRLQQAKDITKLTYNAPLNRNEAKIAHETVWWPGIGYSLGVTTFDHKQCDKIQATFQSKWIAKMGYNRAMSNAIRYGPLDFGGIALRTIWIEQGLQHTLLAMFHLRAADRVGTELMISLSSTQLEAGIEEPFLQTNWKTYGRYVTNTWLTHTWEFLSSIGIQIRIPTVWTPKRQREKDTFLMEHANDFYPKGAATLQKITRCRLYLKVTTLSDIADATGKYIEEHAWRGNRPKHRKSLLNFPEYKKPPTPDWTAWRKFLQRLLIDPYNPKSRIKDEYSLGAWHKQRHDEWYSMYSPETQRIYLRKPNNIIHSYSKSNNNNTRFQRTPRAEATLPPDAIPISIPSGMTTTGTPTASNVEPLGINSPNVPTTQSPTNQRDQFECENIPADLRTILENLPSWQRQRIENLKLCPAFRTQYSASYVTTQLGSVSDGSAPHHGSFAWKVVNLQHETNLAQGGGVSHHYDGMTSHRMETDGILGCDIFLAAVHTWLNLPGYMAKMQHYCDNEEAVNRSNEPDFPHLTNYTLHDYDLHKSIKQFRTQRPHHESVWIKGHQDKDCTNTSSLPYPTRLNIEADVLANEYHQKHHPHYLEPPPTIHLYLNEHPITWKLSKCIRFVASEEPLRKKILEKHPDWNEEIFSQIAWKAIGRTTKRLPQYRQTRITKLQHKWTPTHKLLSKYNNAIDSRCKNCNRRRDETEEHVIRCSHENITTARDIALVQLSTALSDLMTPPDVSHALMYGIETWIAQEQHIGQNPPTIQWPPTNYTYDITCTEHRNIAEAFQMQTQIGWDELMRGRICKKWGNIIQHHFHTTSAPKQLNRDTWEYTIIENIWSIFEATWNARNALIHGPNDEENQKQKR